MAGDEKDGYYCSICGGIPPDKIKTRLICIDGKDTGIDHLDFIINEVKKLKLIDDGEIAVELMKRVNEFNYVPSKKTGPYTTALLKEYRAVVACDV
ncbi:MAG: NAC family transcription factor [Methanomicrobiales archaeon]|nr:NAC family transcription factor [Methanomicrobiales archaeon]